MFSFFRSRRVGIDIVNVDRFIVHTRDVSDPFLKKTFTSDELAYCFSFDDPTPHLAGLYAAKEAVSKSFDAKKLPFIEVEIRHGETGAPEAYRAGKKLPISISISHTHVAACAVAVG